MERRASFGRAGHSLRAEVHTHGQKRHTHTLGEARQEICHLGEGFEELTAGIELLFKGASTATRNIKMPSFLALGELPDRLVSFKLGSQGVIKSVLAESESCCNLTSPQIAPMDRIGKIYTHFCK